MSVTETNAWVWLISDTNHGGATMYLSSSGTLFWSRMTFAGSSTCRKASAGCDVDPAYCTGVSGEPLVPMTFAAAQPV